MEILGFDVERNQDSGLEIDFILKSKEGRFVGEVEGKESRQIHIDKVQQLTVNVLARLVTRRSV